MWIVRRTPRGISYIEDEFCYFEQLQGSGSIWVSLQRDAARFTHRSKAISILRRLQMTGPGDFKIAKLVKKSAHTKGPARGE